MNLSRATFYGKVKNGKLKLENKKVMEMYIEMFPEAAELQVSIEKRKKPGSDKQNRYYWGVIVAILGSYFGYTPDEMHEALKWQFLKNEGKIPTVLSTADLSTVEREDLYSKIRQWAWEEFQVFIPKPNEPGEYQYSTPF